MADLSATKTVSDAKPNVVDQGTFTVTQNNQGLTPPRGCQAAIVLAHRFLRAIGHR